MTRHRMGFVLVALALGGAACTRAPIGNEPDLAGAADLGAGADLAPPPDLARSRDLVPPGPPDLVPFSCRTDKMQFTQATGCQNDGSVEWCIRKGDLAMRAKLQAISTLITCGGCCRGRAGCDTQIEELCFFPTRPPQCEPQPPGGLTWDAWQKLCAVAALAEVREIVHTILE